MSKFTLGDVALENPIMLAPMAGVSDQSFRTICSRYGADFCVSEMISAKGMHYNDIKTGILASDDGSSCPMAVQIFGSEPDIMAESAVKLSSLSYAGCHSVRKPTAIDINMGCPVHKIVSNGEGSALLRNPELIGEIVGAVSSAVDIPVTVKIRTGFDDSHINAPEIAGIAEKNGAKMLTVHGRTREGMYFAPIDYETIANVKKSVSIPVIANGGIFSYDDAMNMYEKTNADGIAIGRGAEGNPFIFAEIKARMSGNEYNMPTDREKAEAALYHAELLVRDKGEYTGVREARKHIAWYLRGVRGSAEIRAKCNFVETLDDIKAVLRKISDR